MTLNEPVRAWEEQIFIPTYLVPPPDRNPMFLEKRVYQGSSGAVYPNPFTDRVSDEKREMAYRAVFLENEYIQVMILPEIGGRVHAALDKTNGYDFIYRQRVIKPALVGLLGPWISGGIEFNWPQHHRPSTFMPVDSLVEERADGSRTVWLSEHEPMNRMKGMVGITLYPGKALIEARVRLYNRTPLVQTFLWWANLAVRVHEDYEAFFPPDVAYVADHAKRALSEFPMARGFYYGADYRQGVDLRWYKNIPVPTSYMVTDSRYDFLGGYDHARQAGVVHVADHHIAPGKKLWTWGNAEFGYAWDRELTDSGGPYVELMAGVYTDNQPDFSWLRPYETKTFRQIWYPIQQIGPVKNANERVAVNLERTVEGVKLGVCSSEAFPGARIELKVDQAVAPALLDRTYDLIPGRPYVEAVTLAPAIADSGLLLVVAERDGRELIRYRPEVIERKPLPSPASEPAAPEKMGSVEELYLTGLHLEQYRHPTWRPEPYWQEAVRRDPGHSPSHTALGRLRLRRGEFQKAERHLQSAINRLTQRNPNPYDGEAYYHLGLALKYQDQLDEADAAFYKAAWNQSWMVASYIALAEIDCLRRHHSAALDHLNRVLEADAENLKAGNLKAAILRRLGRSCEAEALARKNLAVDPLDFWAQNELRAAALERERPARTTALPTPSSLAPGDGVPAAARTIQTVLDIAFDYSSAGLWEEAIKLLTDSALGSADWEKGQGREGGCAANVYPLVLYALGYFFDKAGNHARALECYRQAGTLPPDYCFPARLEELAVLQHAVQTDPANAKAFYYIGNLLYDKKRYDEAIHNWEQSCRLDSSFSIPWRNLGIAYFNIHHDPAKALVAYGHAFEVSPNDARLLYELDQLRKRTGASAKERLAFLERYPDLIDGRDDLVLERATLYNQTADPQKALEILLSRRFHPWEGGEGLVSAQYVWAHVLLGEELLESGRPAEALAHFQQARRYPESLGEGKHLLTPENHLDGWEGVAQRALGNEEAARASFRRAAEGRGELSAMTYHQAMALRELGDAGAREKFRELMQFAARKMSAPAKIDYFATSLPDFLVFEDDLEKRNRVESLYLLGLARLGLDEPEEAEAAFREALSLDLNHLGAQQALRWLHVAP